MPRRNRKVRSTVPVSVDHGPDERWQHDPKETEPERQGAVMVPRARVADCGMVERYYRRGHLGGGDLALRRLATARRYRSLAWRAGRRIRPAMSSTERIDAGPQETGDTDAAIRIAKLDKAIGPLHAACIFAVVVEDHSAAAWARGRGVLRNGAGLAYLIDALDLVERLLPLTRTSDCPPCAS